MCARKQELLSMQGTKLELEECRVLILKRVAVSAAAELLLDEKYHIDNLVYQQTKTFGA